LTDNKKRSRSRTDAAGLVDGPALAVEVGDRIHDQCARYVNSVVLARGKERGGFPSRRRAQGRVGLVADGLGIATTVAIPTLALLVTVLGAVGLVNLIAYFPARSAARPRPAVALRTE
jgi:ABC-type antimicrobial peptide transport system permease subunit